MQVTARISISSNGELFSQFVEGCPGVHQGCPANPVWARGEGSDGRGEWGKRTPWGTPQPALHMEGHPEPD